MSFDQDYYAKYIWDYFITKISNEYGVAGLIGNLQAESALCPFRIQGDFSTDYADSKTYTDKVDTGAISEDDFVNNGPGGGGYGLAQWTYYSRKQNLYNKWKNGNYSSIGCIELACDFLYQELQGYTGVFNTLKNATSVRQASDSVLHDFENPADQSTAVEEKRSSLGEAWYTKYKGSSGSGSNTPSSILTEQQAIERIVACAKAQLDSGYYADGDASNGSLKTWYAEKMWEEHPNFYNGNKNGYDWCTVFVDWCFIECFGDDNTRSMTGEKIGGGGASATNSFNYFIDKGPQYYSRTVPRVGAQIFFDWDGASGSDTINLADHTGIVIEYDEAEGKVTTIEGNTKYNGHNSAVGTRTFYTNTYKYVRGYGYPDWSVVLNYTPATNTFRTPYGTVPAPGGGDVVVKKYGVRIDGKLYTPYIYKDSQWRKATPYVYNGSNWIKTN